LLAVKFGHGRITSGFEWSSVDVIAWIPLLYSVLHTEQYVITMRATTFLQDSSICGQCSSKSKAYD